MVPQREAKNRPRPRHLTETMRGPLREPPGALGVLNYIIGGGHVPGTPLTGPWEVCMAQNRLGKARAYICFFQPVLGSAYFPRPR